MSKIVWDKAGEHFYETGVDHGVLYPTDNGVYGAGVPWNGLTNVTESPSGAESTGQYADNIKYLNLISAEEFGATVEAFYYPPEFSVCDGSAEPVKGVIIGQQVRRPFGLCYRTLRGNDLMGTDYGYKLHLVYGATASPSERAYGTVNDSPEAITFSWTLTTTPVEVTGYRPTASLIIDSTLVSKANMAKLENMLYGTESSEPKLPMPDEVIALIGSSTAINVTVTPIPGNTVILGKAVSNLQENITIGDNAITGKLLYVDDYTGYSSNPSEQEGNYLALQFACDMPDAVMTTQLIGGTTGEKTLDEDKQCVYRVTSPSTQAVRITATKGKDAITKTFALSGIEVASAASLG